MSSGSQREQPTGVIRQGNRVVGCIVMPEADDVFIREFNHCYGQLRLSVASTPNPVPKTTDPHTFQLPTWFRHVWHSVHPEPAATGSMGQISTEPNSPPGVPTAGIPTPGIPASENATAAQAPLNSLSAPTAKPAKSSRKIESTSDDSVAKAKPRRRKSSESTEQNQED